MPRPAIKTDKVEVGMTSNEKKRIARLTALSDKHSMSEYMLYCALNYPLNNSGDNDQELISLVKNDIKTKESFQKQQQRSMYMVMQFLMLISSKQISKDEVMKFYENAYRDAVAEYGKEDD